jgi:hypothetical protein
MTYEIKGSYIEKLFDLICGVYLKHGFKRQGWQGWPSLNEYYPSHIPGNFLVTDEHDYLSEFRSPDGSHPILGSGMIGDNAGAWAEISGLLGLELADDLDGANFLTYPGHRKRYYRITAAEYAGDWSGNGQTADRPRDIADTVSVLQQLNRATEWMV